MRLVILHNGGAPKEGVTYYDIGIQIGDDITMRMHPPPAELPRLQALLPRIKAMAESLLGTDFVSLNLCDNLPVLELIVQTGTSKGPRRFDFRDFCGWVALCDYNPESAIEHHQV